jgi:hypothetical protein
MPPSSLDTDHDTPLATFTSWAESKYQIKTSADPSTSIDGQT